MELLDERSKQYSVAGDDSVSETITDLVRGTLCPAIKQVLEHGMKRPSFLGKKNFLFIYADWMLIVCNDNKHSTILIFLNSELLLPMYLCARAAICPNLNRTLPVFGVIFVMFQSGKNNIIWRIIPILWNLFHAMKKSTIFQESIKFSILNV